MNTTSEQKIFVDAYNGLLDVLAEANPTRLFWATDLASKNRFSCCLPDLLEAIAQRREIGKIRDIRFKRMAGIVYHGLRLGLRMMRARPLLKRLLPGETYSVVKTFSYDHSFDKNGVYRDVFLGQLPGYLNSKGRIFVLSQVLGNYGFFLRHARSSEILILPLEAFLTWPDLIKAAWEMLTVPVRVPQPLKFLGQDVQGLVRRCLDATFKGVQMQHFIHWGAITHLARKVRVRAFYMTYENYPWERMAIMALRQNSPTTKIIGIQHTVVPQAFLNYFASAAEVQHKLLPDAVYTTGEHTADIMRRYSSAQSVPVAAGCALRFEALGGVMTAPRRRVKNILLALEASAKTEAMVRSVFDQLQGDGHYQVRVRTHPLLPWKVLAEKMHLQAQGNTAESTGSLQEDLTWADAVIYWSTTVSLEALVMGKPVIHFKNPGLLSFDPLFECPHLKWTVDGQGSLRGVLQEIDAVSDEDFALFQQKAKEYLDLYFCPVTSQRLEALC